MYTLSLLQDVVNNLIRIQFFWVAAAHQTKISKVPKLGSSNWDWGRTKVNAWQLPIGIGVGPRWMP